MSQSILITGISGFVGGKMLEKMAESCDHSIYGLVREPKKLGLDQRKPKNIEILQGDLKYPESYIPVLKRVDTVIHMASVTGKSGRREYDRVIAQGTRMLVSACREAGVKSILHVSSIAVKFKKKKRYFYARAKQEAESCVRDSGLKYTILRPTIILGQGSPVFSGFSLFAGLPLVPLFGRGEVQIQPIHVDDVVRGILHIVDHSLFNNGIIELGGPQTISVRDFLNRIHVEKKGKPSRFLRFPMGLTVFALGVVEPFLYPILPFTLGQLATFRNEGTAEKNDVHAILSPHLKSLDDMIHDSMKPPVPRWTTLELENECRVFCRYLLKKQSSDYVTEKYIQCHRRVELVFKNKFDQFLLRWASKGPFFAKLCDSYSRFFYPRSIYRKKMIYLLAILETSPPYAQIIDRADEKGKIWLGFQVVFRGIGFAMALFSSFFFLFPLQVLLKSKNTGDR